MYNQRSSEEYARREGVLVELMSGGLDKTASVAAGSIVGGVLGGGVGALASDPGDRLRNGLIGAGVGVGVGAGLGHLYAKAAKSHIASGSSVMVKRKGDAVYVVRKGPDGREVASKLTMKGDIPIADGSAYHFKTDRSFADGRHLFEHMQANPNMYKTSALIKRAGVAHRAIAGVAGGGVLGAYDTKKLSPAERRRRIIMGALLGGGTMGGIALLSKNLPRAARGSVKTSSVAIGGLVGAGVGGGIGAVSAGDGNRLRDGLIGAGVGAGIGAAIGRAYGHAYKGGYASGFKDSGGEAVLVRKRGNDIFVTRVNKDGRPEVLRMKNLDQDTIDTIGKMSGSEGRWVPFTL